MTKFFLGALAGALGVLAIGAFWSVSDVQAHADTELQPITGVVRP